MNKKSSAQLFSILGFVIFMCFISKSVIAGPSDTIIVQTINFTDTLQYGALTYVYPPPQGGFHQTQENYYQGGKYLFPSDTIRFEKILMNFTIRCDPANSPACGQWDYIGYIYAYKDTNRWELGRYETPFGINLYPGSDGFTWTYDVSDFRTVLFDSVSIKYVVPQQGHVRHELIDLKFIMIEGTPPRDVIKIENLWYGGFRFGDTIDPVEDHLQPITISLLPDVQTAKIRATVSGDGYGGSTGCAEFCSKQHSFDVDGINRFNWNVWKNDCSMNPLYPQGGTWIYNRSNRCPGEPMITKEFELTPYITGSTVILHYRMQPYVYPQDGTFWPVYTIETQLVSYGSPNFTLDAAIWDIKSPCKTDMYNRMNPVCDNPVITIKNTGSTTLTSLTITYGIEGGPQSTYYWTGNLPFLQTKDVSLPPFNWSSKNQFKVTVSNPNGGADQYPNNNSMESTYNVPPQFPGALIFDLLTDAHYNQYGYNQGSYTLKNENGDTVWQRPNNLLPSTLYKDTINLANGCYEFHFIDDMGITDTTDENYNQGDGMTNWPDDTNTSGHMMIKKKSNGVILKSFNMDFGREMYLQFTVGYNLDVPVLTYDDVITIYPDPSTGIFNLDMSFNEPQDISVIIYDLMGRRIYDEIIHDVMIENHSIDLSGEPNGLYFARIFSKHKQLTRKLIKK
ncbi:MAG: peptide-N-glycosidase F-related protein [Bacteroidia bacterium]|nr:peptide-N-glycosidase F-related protein [Bacteroidia bacterium]